MNDGRVERGNPVQVNVVVMVNERSYQQPQEKHDKSRLGGDSLLMFYHEILILSR